MKTAMQYVICNTEIWIPQPKGSPADGAVTGRRVERGDPPGNPAARDRSEQMYICVTFLVDDVGICLQVDIYW